MNTFSGAHFSKKKKKQSAKDFYKGLNDHKSSCSTNKNCWDGTHAAGQVNKIKTSYK